MLSISGSSAPHKPDSCSAAERVLPPSSVTLPSSIALRLRHLATRLHQLGPRPLYEWAAEIIAGSTDPLGRLEVYGRLDPQTLHALGADTLSPLIVCIK
jgi:hypothetical protein